MIPENEILGDLNQRPECPIAAYKTPGPIPVLN
jgi:hypothetical protein